MHPRISHGLLHTPCPCRSPHKLFIKPTFYPLTSPNHAVERKKRKKENPRNLKKKNSAIPANPQKLTRTTPACLVQVTLTHSDKQNAVPRTITSQACKNNIVYTHYDLDSRSFFPSPTHAVHSRLVSSAYTERTSTNTKRKSSIVYQMGLFH